jgi:hypothetical protein
MSSIVGQSHAAATGNFQKHLERIIHITKIMHRDM